MRADLFDWRGALFSEDRKHRFALWRLWRPSGAYVTFVLLNPSTADEERDDPTIRRCIGYAEKWGFGGVVILNLFSFRTYNPKEMREQGAGANLPENDDFIRWFNRGSWETVCAWGAHGNFLGRAHEVFPMISNPRCLSRTKDGEPSHPLYLKKTLRTRRYHREGRGQG